MSDKLRDALQLASKELHNASSNEGTRAEVADAIDAALSAEPEKCVWRHNDYGYHTGCPQGVWLSSELLHIIGCYIEDGLNAIVYCPGCGREIEVKGE